jgi:transcriptional regulatory protein LevR
MFTGGLEMITGSRKWIEMKFSKNLQNTCAISLSHANGENLQKSFKNHAISLNHANSEILQQLPEAYANSVSLAWLGFFLRY